MKIRKPQNKTKKELRRKRKRFIIITILFIIMVVSFIWIMNNERFKISDSQLFGNKTILDIDIQNVINNSLEKKFLFLPMDNVLLVNTRYIEKKIKNNFPKIYDANISIEEGSILVVKIEERNPHSLWCKKEDNHEFISLYFDEVCYFADQRGYIYTKAPYFSGGVFEKIYTTNELLKIGEQVLDKDEFIEFFKFTTFLSDNFNVVVDSIFLNDQNETYLYINSLLRKNLVYRPYIIYHTDDDYRVIERNMDLMVNHDLFKEEYESNFSRLKFIDLRIIDQIRYKFMTDEEYLKTKEKDAVDLEIKNEA